MEVFIDVKTLFSYDRRFLKIKNFELTIHKNDYTSVEETRIHIKYVNIKDHDRTKMTIERIDTGDKIKIQLQTEDDASNLINAIRTEKASYDTFMKDYYTNNDSYNLIEGESFFDYFKSITTFLSEMENSLGQIKMDENLEQILSIQNKFLEKISYYTKTIDSNIIKLNSDNVAFANSLSDKVFFLFEILSFKSAIIKSDLDNFSSTSFLPEGVLLENLCGNP